MTKRHGSVVAGVLLAVAGSTAAQTLGTAFTYQGQLRDGGSPANGTYDLTFRLYDQLTGGTQQGATVCVDNVAVAEGLFTATLDFGGQFSGQERFLEVAIRVDGGQNCANTSGFTTLSPRQKLTATPNALNAEKLDGLDSTAFLQAVPNPLTLSGAGSHIIRGNNSSSSGQSVGVFGHTTGTGGGFGVQGQQRGGAGVVPTYGTGVFGSSDTSYGVAGFSSTGDGMWATTFGTSGLTHGLTAESRSTSGVGVKGAATAASGATYGVWGQSDSPEGYGVYGKATATTGWNYGGWFESAGTTGRGIIGQATATTGNTMGGGFESYSPNGIGVWAVARATSGTTCGGWFQARSPSGRAVAGWASAGSGETTGGYFTSSSSSGRGVYGLAEATSGSTFGGYFESNSTNGYGVYGRNSATSGTIYGVRGYASTAAGGYAVYAAGDMGASGFKPFRVDHPSDPENKYLLHYATESPEVLNFYSGNVTLDEHGEAVVELPDYFASINKDPRYTLTAVGAPMPMLHVAEEISAESLEAGERAGADDAPPICWFRIAGGVSGGNVSWRVEALRNDLRMRLHGAPVECDKIGPERGKYQHPEYYGLPAEMGMDYRLDDAGLEPGRALPATVPNVTEQD